MDEVNVSSHGVVRLAMPRHGEARLDGVRRGVGWIWFGLAGLGIAGQGWVWRGVVWRGAASFNGR